MQSYTVPKLNIGGVGQRNPKFDDHSGEGKYIAMNSLQVHISHSRAQNLAPGFSMIAQRPLPSTIIHYHHYAISLACTAHCLVIVLHMMLENFELVLSNCEHGID